MLDAIATHAPTKWADELSSERFGELVQQGPSVNMIVLAADIRSSTFLMKEAINFRRYALLLGEFVTMVRDSIRLRRGWFDKFTGDGFLAYWVVDRRNEADYYEEVLANAYATIEAFRESAVPEFRKNSHNFPASVGISVGIDAGPTYFANVAGDVTIVGPAVVGAVRMVSSAHPFEALTNASLGERLLARGTDLRPSNATIIPDVRATKEYPAGQHVFVVRYSSPKTA